MKKYKLIKEYPGSPKIDSIIETKSYRGYALENSASYFMTEDKVENYPEFWELVVEKDYEILSVSLQRSDKHEIRDVSKYHNTGYIEALISCHGNKIHSVKRISDGEVFTIGDNVKIIKSTNPCVEIGVIHDFSFWLSNINNLKKLKQPLFKTEDDVDIFEDDKCFGVDINYYEWMEFKKSSKNISLKIWKTFSTKEKAEEYIIMNKPCLSLNDVAKVYVSAGFEITSRNKKHPYIKQQLQLRKLIKTKLKKAL